MSRHLIPPLLLAATMVSGCASSDVFNARSVYPPDPYVKGYADPQDCIGGEQLAAVSLDLPDYPGRAFRTGRQGWTIVRLDVGADGRVARADVERAVPDGVFERASERAAHQWVFEPPAGGELTNCRVLIRYRLGQVSLGG